MRICRFFLLALLAGVPSEALAQAPPDWTLGIDLGKPLFVTLANGERMEGTAGSVSADGVVVATPVGVLTARFTDIRKVERRDPVRNGVWIGAAVGAALGVALALDDASCPYDADGCGSGAAVIPVGGALYGALIGWGIDTLIKGRTTLVDTSRAPRVSVAAGPKGVTARLMVSW